LRLTPTTPAFVERNPPHPARAAHAPPRHPKTRLRATLTDRKDPTPYCTTQPRPRGRPGATQAPRRPSGATGAINVSRGLRFICIVQIEHVLCLACMDKRAMHARFFPECHNPWHDVYDHGLTLATRPSAWRVLPNPVTKSDKQKIERKNV
jgi:hypothetical protein